MQKYYQMVHPYLGRIVLTLLGFTVGMLLLTIGFWKTLVLALITTLGYLLGRWKDGVWNPKTLEALPQTIRRNIHF